MNTVDNGEESPEPLGSEPLGSRSGPLRSGSTGLPLSAPVAGSMLQTRRPDIPRQEPAERDSLGYRYMASPTAPAPDTPPHPAPRPATPAEDPHRTTVRGQLDALRVRAAKASSWREASASYARLLNNDGVVPVTARFSRDDIEFLGQAREEVLGLAELGLQLLELHAPLDAGGISTDPSSPILRCRSCMWRWPCPTFRTLTDALSRLPHAGPPHGR
jgi:hypothetical protein